MKPFDFISRSRPAFPWLFLILLLWPGLASAKLMEPEHLLGRILDSQSQVSQFYAEVEVKVFDPEAFAPLGQPLEANYPASEEPHKAFAQKITWIRDEFVAIETTDLLQKPLHLFLELGGRELSLALSKERIFSKTDVYLTPLTLYTKYLSLLKRQIHELGIAPVRVEMELDDLQYVYRLGSEQEALLVDPREYRVIEVRRLIQIGGRNFTLKTRFSDWDQTKKLIPRLIETYLDGRLIKETRLVNLQFSGLTRRKEKLMRAYKDRFPQEKPLQVEVGYGH